MSTQPPQQPGQPGEPWDRPGGSPGESGPGGPGAPSPPPGEPYGPPPGSPPESRPPSPPPAPPGESAQGSPYPPPGGPYEPPTGPAPSFGAPPQPPYGTPPPGAPPGPPTYGDPGAYPPVPPTSTGTDGFAIAGFIFSLLGGLCIGPILCIVALVRISSSKARGKGLAIAGLIISALWILAIIGIVAIIAASEADRDSTGQVTDAGSASVMDIEPGDCLAEAALGRTTTVDLVPCDQPHEAQVVAAFDLPAGSYPGEAAVQSAADEGCADRISQDDSLTQRIGDGEVTVQYLYPEAISFGRGDRTVTCLIVSEQGKLTEKFPVIP